jgi:hypothetical protein
MEDQPDIHCPKCEYRPRPKDRWDCVPGCGTRRHTCCAVCGTTLIDAHAARSNEVGTTLASLEDPSSLAPRAHSWVQDKLAWIGIDDGLAQFATTLASGA